MDEDRGGAEQRLQHSEALYRSIAASLPSTGIFLFDSDLRLLLSHGNVVNEVSWFSDEVFEGRPLGELVVAVPSEVGELSLRHYTAALRGETREFEFSSDDRDFLVKAVPVRSDGTHVDAVLVICQDETESRRAAERLERLVREQQAAARFGQLAIQERDLDSLLKEAARTLAETLGVEFTAILENREAEGELIIRADVGWAYTDRATPIPAASHAGYTLRAGEPVAVEDLADESRFTPSAALIERGITSGISVAIEGREHPYGVVTAHTRERRHFTSEEVGFLTTVANVLAAAVERTREEELNRHAALHDPLTGLPNRVLALDRLNYGIGRRRRDGTDLAVLVVDLDRFKLINDSLGHEAGDELLLELAPRLGDAVRAEDTVARLGGDEFAIICPGLNGVRDVITIAEKLAAAVARPFILSSGERFVTASIGIAVGMRAGDTPETMLRDADVAMYRAKSEGPGRYELFDDAMRAQAMERLRIETELRLALDRGELEVHYQPIVEIDSGLVDAVEALVRWRHPTRGLLGPTEFISVAEETGLIVDIGEMVIERACAQVAEWQRRLGRAVGLSVNISPRQLSNPVLGTLIAATAADHGLLPGSLSLELTESVLISESQTPQDSISELRRHGLRLLLDDFGTGYSSLSYLKRFELDGIKIDHAFVDGLGTDDGDTAIVEAIAGMAQSLGLELVAEGVETELQLRRLRELGCLRAQGYLFAPPRPAADLDVGRRMRLAV
ncbi:MAG TPA: EAL domain-containing protein [Solirubrobacterales bacterium]|nr:EAL domain-containing protein [Solirubrobacterales bacterium]